MKALRRWAPWLLLALLAAGLAGCNTGIAEGEAEHRIRQRLPQIIGPAESYTVRVRAGSDLSAIQGNLREVTIEGKRVRIGNQWPVDELSVVLQKVRFDVHHEVLKEVGAARFQVAIRPATVVRYLDDPKNLRNVNVQLDENKITLLGDYKVLRLWAPFKVSGDLVLQDKEKIGFRASKASAVGIPVPEFIIHYLEGKLNPILDVGDIEMPLDLTDVQVHPTGIIVSGTPHLEDLTALTGR